MFSLISTKARDRGIVLNFRLSAEGNVVSSTTKKRVMCDVIVSLWISQSKVSHYLFIPYLLSFPILWRYYTRQDADASHEVCEMASA